VIAANSPGIRESVIDGQTGFLVAPDDVEAMTAAMRGIVESPALVSSLGAAGRLYAETFTWDRAANDTLAHLEQVIAR
jgi:glycosyltransferase involved in cell wall biosynthesis